MYFSFSAVFTPFLNVFSLFAQIFVYSLLYCTSDGIRMHFSKKPKQNKLSLLAYF